MATSSADQTSTPKSSSATLPNLLGWVARVAAALLLVEAGLGVLVWLHLDKSARQIFLLNPGFDLFHRLSLVIGSAGINGALAHVVGIILILAVSSGLGTLSRRFFISARYQTYLNQYEDLKQRHQLADNAPALSTVHRVAGRHENGSSKKPQRTAQSLCRSQAQTR